MLVNPALRDSTAAANLSGHRLQQLGEVGDDDREVGPPLRVRVPALLDQTLQRLHKNKSHKYLTAPSPIVPSLG